MVPRKRGELHNCRGGLRPSLRTMDPRAAEALKQVGTMGRK